MSPFGSLKNQHHSALRSNTAALPDDDAITVSNDRVSDVAQNSQNALSQFDEKDLVIRSLLAKTDTATIKRAWFEMAHLILDTGSRVLDIGCGNGQKTYAMAVMNPQHHFVGIDQNTERVSHAKLNYKLPNLEYIVGDVKNTSLPPNSFDAIINSFTLHEIYSSTHCCEKAVSESLEDNFGLLKPEGYFFLRDYAMPNPEEYVVLEIPEEQKHGEGIYGLSDIELLISFSEQARARKNLVHGGFYLEELPARFPKTRRFRLPHKWAYEFLLRKDDRDKWDEKLQKEYTFFTERDFRKTLRSFGGRVFYSAPHWDESFIKKHFKKKFRLYSEDGKLLGYPATSFICLTQKIEERTSQIFMERRPDRTKSATISITAMRDDFDGRLVDIVSRGIEISEILPYYVTPQGGLRLFVHQGAPRALANTIPRMSSVLDGKKWSGHMTEAISLPAEAYHEIKDDEAPSLKAFAEKYLGMHPKVDAVLEDGPLLYPSPDYIDERIETKYLNVNPDTFNPKTFKPLRDFEGFSTHGQIRDVDAQDILNAAGVGLLPTCRLEVQIMALYEKLGLPYQAWAESPLSLDAGDVPEPTKLETIIHKLAKHDDRFKPAKGTAGEIKTYNSIFVEEGQDQGGITGLSSNNLEFIMQDKGTQNIAVVLPLCKTHSGEVMAGIVENYLPVPQRYKGSGYIISCPSYPLPADIDNFELAEKFIAEKFEVDINYVARMGEGYFTHVGLTPQRIYPFAVSTAGATGWKAKGRGQGTCSYGPVYDLWKLLYLDNNDSFLKVASMHMQTSLGLDSALSATTTMRPMYHQKISSPVANRASAIPSNDLGNDSAGEKSANSSLESSSSSISSASSSSSAKKRDMSYDPS